MLGQKPRKSEKMLRAKDIFRGKYAKKGERGAKGARAVNLKKK